MTITKLLEAEQIALDLFNEAESRQMISAGKTEETLSKEMFELASDMFGIEKHWHKRIVRCGPNTLAPYHENPPNLTIQTDDILFFDFGPIIEKWEADLGRTYVIGNDPYKLKLKNDIELAWKQTREWFNMHSKVKACDLFEYAAGKAKTFGWEFGGEIAGHLIGEFPHEKLEKGDRHLYVHLDNPNDMSLPDAEGNKRHWILEMHFVDREKKIGGFYEQLLT